MGAVSWRGGFVRFDKTWPITLGGRSIVVVAVGGVNGSDHYEHPGRLPLGGAEERW